ncbi:ABC transporter substrate-binding protein [Schleiferilactobacillus harbinensis]|uniref:ABC transporter substrate-binding protein n=3 Tax=Schleiferilactobacillus harbinensis TaxID=304207 RepID=A0A5P8M0V4_9LACO|nr:ABC transporter substrate-binding protein [Schleiferilactobacillus harbinensis]
MEEIIMKKRYWLLTVVSMVLLLVLGACGSPAQGSSQDSKKIKIGILQLMNQTALDDARKGFIAELAKAGYKDGKNISIHYVNAQNDQANLKSMSEELAKDKNTVNLAIATPAAQALLQADKDTPQLFTAITDPVEAKLVTSLQHPGGNVTGTSDLVPVSGQIKLLHELFPKAKTIGLLYNVAEPNSLVQVKMAKAAIAKLGLKSTSLTVASTNDVSQAMTSLAGKADAIYVPADNVVAAAMATVGKISAEKKVPVVPAASTMVPAGGIATNGIDYEKLGAQTAQMAIKIIKGKKASAIPVQLPKDITLVVNKKLAKVFKIDPAQVVNDAK